MSTEAETTSATGTVATPTKVAPAKEAPAKEGGSAPTTPSKETDDARIQLTQGRRHLLVKDYFSAVTALAKGCELLAQKFGDTAPELGDAYLTYGRALLELARSESGVLGMNEGETAAEDEEDDGEGEEGEGEDEGEEGEEKDDAEAKENGEAAAADTKENGTEAKENGKDAETKENGAEAKENGKDAEAKENGAEAKENGKDAEAKENGAEVKNGTDNEATNGAADPDQTLKEDEEDEEVNNLQLSWEVLELAKGIFQKQIEDEQESKQTCLKLAEVHLKLGEVGVESENYTTAVEDMKACLELQKKYLDEDDRRIAETLYNMGVAYSLANEFDAAIDQFKSASVQIEKRIENLEKKKSEPVPEEKSATDDPFYTVQGEIDELKALLPEMKDKVSDMQDFKKETVRRMMDGLAEASAKQSSTADGAGPSTASTTAAASDKPVSSVAHLVKRKPKEEVKEEAPATAADKPVKAEKMDTSPVKTDKMDTSPVKTTEVKTEKVESSSAESTKEKTEKVESVTAESTEEKKTDEEVSDRKRKPEDPVEVEDPTKKAKVEESAESKPSE